LFDDCYDTHRFSKLKYKSTACRNNRQSLFAGIFGCGNYYN
jgi:hypothetical protein